MVDKKIIHKAGEIIEVAAEIAAIWAPGVDIAVTQLKKYLESRTNDRILNFHKFLLEANPDKELSKDDLKEADFLVYFKPAFWMWTKKKLKHTQILRSQSA